MTLQEIYYYVGQGNKVTQDDSTIEAASISAKTKGDKELTEALMGDLLQSGALPAAETGTNEGQKALAEMFGDVGTTKKTKKEKTPTEPAEPKTDEE